MRITKTSRDTHQFSPDFFRADGSVVFDGYASARRFAAQLSAGQSQPTPASDLYALSLIDEALRALVLRFVPPPVMNTAVTSVSEQVGTDSIAVTQQRFISEFPPDSVYRGEERTEDYIARLSNGKIKTVEELIYIYTHNANPAIQRNGVSSLVAEALVRSADIGQVGLIVPCLRGCLQAGLWKACHPRTSG